MPASSWSAAGPEAAPLEAMPAVGGTTAVHPPRAIALEVIKVVEETADAMSLVLRPVDPASPAPDYRPGQFLTLRIPRPDGSFVGRCYSLSSSPFADEPLKVTVKRTAGGYGSNWICDNAAPGLRLDALAPSGLFTPADLDQDLLLIAGGSGITPILSILTSALLKGSGRITLLYANVDAASVIFAAQLAQLAAEYPERLTVIHWLSAERGLPSAADLQTMLAPFRAYSAFVCGPGPLMPIVGEALRACGVPAGRIAVETFVSLAGDPFAGVDARSTAEAGDDTRLSLELYGEELILMWPREMVLLDLLMSQDIEVAYSCREGVCGTCICKLERGRVRMPQNQVLDASDLAAGYVLACQSLPDSEDCRIVF